MRELLARHENGTVNFDTRILTTKQEVTTDNLRANLVELFDQPADVVLFYFSGHGTLDENFGGYLVSSNPRQHAWGIPMSEILTLANQSIGKVKEVFIILDCCKSGALGIPQGAATEHSTVSLNKDRSFLTASGINENAREGHGLSAFTALVVDALDGGAADILGHVNAASIYAYVDEVMGSSWTHRPQFKSNVSHLNPLRFCHEQVPLDVLRRLNVYFTQINSSLQLDPSYEPFPPNGHQTPRNEDNEKIFGELQKCRAARLVEPHGTKPTGEPIEHMYDAAMLSQYCRLTKLGQFYWRLAKENNI